jgi:dTDP-4-amino-4,6-dideoxygalactose transaminase
MANQRIYLSPPHMSERERELLLDAFDSNWIAPLGPHVDALESEFAAKLSMGEAVAVSSGTAALHLSLRLLGVGAGDEVLTSTLTFAATANAITYCGASPVFLDSDHRTWNMDPNLLEDELRDCDRRGRLPKAAVVVDLYGQCADYDSIEGMCGRYDVPIVEDAAEALGAWYKNRPAGSFGHAGCFSLNGNKIITASGGGLLVSQDTELCRQARHLATQARDPAPHYQHSQIGYNYRMSNLLAAVARGQLQVLDDRVAARRRNFASYHDVLAEYPGIDFMPEPVGFFSTRWLTCLTVDPRQFGGDREMIRLHLDSQNIESRPVWKPLHLQPAFAGCRHRGGAVAEALFRNGLCLPSGSSLSEEDRQRVVRAIQGVARPGRRTVRSAA